MNDIFFRSPTDMEPLMPKHGEAELIELACEIFRLSGKLSGILHPITFSGKPCNAESSPAEKPAVSQIAVKEPREIF